MKKKQWTRVRLQALAIMLVIILLLGLALGSTSSRRPQSVDLLLSTASAAVGDEVSLTTGLTPVVERVLPSVVNIWSERIVRISDSGHTSPFFFDPFFGQFFGGEGPWGGPPREQRERGLGSGVIVSADGYILTNNHVVENASEIRVSLSDRREMKAKIVGTDPRTDIAVLKVEEKDLPALPIGDSTKVKPGQFVLAIGNPFGLSQTVTMGIVSAKGRGNLGIEDYEDFIQTDAAINPGNSGGALVDVHGALIGINTAILSRSGGNQGIGFAVPINMARQVMERIVKDGRVIRGWLGVSIQPVTPKVGRAFDLEKAEGALVGDVTPGSPAEDAGLKRGDIIVSIEGEPIVEMRELSLKVSMLAPGTTVRLKIVRDGREMEIPAVLGEQPSEPNTFKAGTERAAGHPLEGVQVQDLTPQILRQLDLPRNTTGVVVVRVAPDTPAAEAGLRRGDVIQEANGHVVADVYQFEQAVRRSAGEPVVLLVNRGGQTLFVVVEAQ
jgi:serine protease Do